MARFGDLTNDEKLARIAAITKEIKKLNEIKEQQRLASKYTDDLKDLSLREIIVEDGDGKPALMAHVNALAKRVKELESFHFGFEKRAIADLNATEKVLAEKIYTAQP